MINNVHDTIIKDSKVIIDDLSKPLNSVKIELIENCKQLTKLIETHKKSQEVFLSEIEAILIKYNTKNIEVYNNIITTVSNKIEAAKNDLETNMTLNFNKTGNELLKLNDTLKNNTSDLINNLKQ